MPDDRFDEKEAEKRDEKSPQEKSWDEKGRNDPLGTITWAAILVWAGVVLLAGNLGLLGTLGRSLPGLPGIQFGSWPVIFVGAGVILLIEVVVRLLLPDYRRPVGGNIFLAVIFIGIGLGDIFSWNIIWPLILIGLGLSVLLRGAGRR
jgi:hypothetical protein